MTTRLILISLPVQIGEDREETGEVVEFYVPVLLHRDPTEDECDRWLDLSEKYTPRIRLLETAMTAYVPTGSARSMARIINEKALKIAREQFDREQREGQTP